MRMGPTDEVDDGERVETAVPSGAYFPGGKVHVHEGRGSEDRFVSYHPLTIWESRPSFLPKMQKSRTTFGDTLRYTSATDEFGCPCWGRCGASHSTASCSLGTEIVSRVLHVQRGRAPPCSSWPRVHPSGQHAAPHKGLRSHESWDGPERNRPMLHPPRGAAIAKRQFPDIPGSPSFSCFAMGNMPGYATIQAENVNECETQLSHVGMAA